MEKVNDKIEKLPIEWVLFNKVSIACLQKKKGEHVLSASINEVNDELIKLSTETEKAKKKIRRKYCSVKEDGTLIKHYSYAPATDKNPGQEIEHYSYTADAEEKAEAELEALANKKWSVAPSICETVPSDLTEQEVFVFKGVVIPADYVKPSLVSTNGSPLVHEGV